MNEWDRADADGMEMVNSAQYHAGLNQLWNALRDEDGNLDTQGQDVYTLAAEAIEERNALQCLLDAGDQYSDTLEEEVRALKCLNRNLWDRIHINRTALSIISNVSKAIRWGGRAAPTLIELAEETLEGKYN